MSNILDETLEDIKSQHRMHLLFKYASFAGLGLILMLIFALGTTWWLNRKNEQIYEAGGQYLAAALKIATQEQEDWALKSQVILNQLEKLSYQDNTIYNHVASLKYASILSYQHEFNKAIPIYLHIKNDKNAKKWIRDYAELMYINSKMMTNSIEPLQIIEELKNFIKSDPVFKIYAQTLLAVMMLEQGLKDEARALLEESSQQNNMELYDIASFLKVLVR